MYVQVCAREAGLRRREVWPVRPPIQTPCCGDAGGCHCGCRILQAAVMANCVTWCLSLVVFVWSTFRLMHCELEEYLKQALLWWVGRTPSAPLACKAGPWFGHVFTILWLFRFSRVLNPGLNFTIPLVCGCPWSPWAAVPCGHHVLQVHELLWVGKQAASSTAPICAAPYMSYLSAL